MIIPLDAGACGSTPAPTILRFFLRSLATRSAPSFRVPIHDASEFSLTFTRRAMTRRTLISGAEVARLLKVSKQAVSQWANDGMPYHVHRTNGRRLFDLARVVTWREDVAFGRVKRFYSKAFA